LPDPRGRDILNRRDHATTEVSMKMIATAVLGAVLLAPAAAAAQQDFEGMVRIRMSGGAGDAMEMTQYVKGNMRRVEFSEMGSMGAGEMFMLINGETGAVSMVMPSQKMYMEMGGSGMRGGAGGDRDAEPPALTATGRTETVAGHTCEHYTMKTESGDMDLCVAKGLGWGVLGTGMGGGGGRGMGGMGGMAGMRGMGGPDMDPRWVRFWREHFRDGFMPLKMSGRSDGQEFTMEVLEIDRRSVSDDMMRIPADFTGMSMGRRGGAPPGGGRTG
jgi:hypothetical protein